MQTDLSAGSRTRGNQLNGDLCVHVGWGPNALHSSGTFAYSTRISQEKRAGLSQLFSPKQRHNLVLACILIQLIMLMNP